MNKIKANRQNKKLTVEDLVFKLREQGHRVSCATINRYERGQGRNVDLLSQIAKALDVNLADLLN